MNRINEIDETISKLRSEKTFLRDTPPVNTYPGQGLDAMNTCGQAAQERSPEQVIEQLFTYHPVTDEAQQLKYGMVRDAAKALALQIWKACPYGSDRTAAIRKLREAVMTANAAIALNGISLNG